MTIIEPNSTDLTDIQTIFTYINNVATEGFFFSVVLIIIWAVAFVGVLANGRGAARSWTYSSFITVIIGILFGIMGLINKNIIYLNVLMVAVGVAWMQIQGAGDN